MNNSQSASKMTVVSDELFQKLKLSKQHEELVNTLNKLIDALKAPVTPAADPVLTTALERNSKAIAVFAKSLPELTSQQSIIEAINNLQGSIVYQPPVEDKPKEWRFDIERGINGKITGVTAVQESVGEEVTEVEDVWHFDIERDSEDRISGITAKAIT